ncbi:MAG: signal peptidase II [Bacteroidetes bacterium]|nr:signal peptidase II [Bacteroidota bacterium]
MKVLFISLSIVILDQVTKLLVKGFTIPLLNIHYIGMFSGQKIPIIGDFFRLTFIENPGMAFGFDPGSKMKLWISLFSLFASIGLLIYLYLIRKKSLSLRIAIACIIGGAVGNLIDRMFYGVFYHYAPLFYGRVVDFLDFDFFKFNLFGRSFDRWPIFNFADASVTIGVLILLFFYRSSNSENQKAEELPIETNSSQEVESK